MASNEYIVDDYIRLRIKGDEIIVELGGNELLVMKNGNVAQFCNAVDKIVLAPVPYEHKLDPGFAPTRDHLSTREEFDDLCMNLQEWSENGYDPALLRMNITYPLLRYMSTMGLPGMRRLLSREIIDIIGHANEKTFEFVHDCGLVRYLDHDELVEAISLRAGELREPDRSIIIHLQDTLSKPIRYTYNHDEKCIIILHLNGFGLKVFPECLFELRELMWLFLDHNDLKEIPDTIGTLEDLRILNLSHNQLSSLPESIGNLSLLAHLLVNNNDLTRLPDSICRLKHVCVINFLGNHKFQYTIEIARWLKDQITLFRKYPPQCWKYPPIPSHLLNPRRTSR